MPTTVLEAIPPAVLAGLVLGALFAVFAAGLFVAGERLFPTATTASRSSTAGSHADTSEDRRRGEIRAYLGSIGERYAESYPIDGQTVAFYLPDRDVAVTFDAHVFFHIQNATDTYAVLCEHEMHGSHLGARLPFSVPDVDTKPYAPEDPIRSAYEALGLTKSASREDVRTAYREQIKEAHPDHGGSKESFHEIQEAYATVKEHAQ